MRVTVTLDDDVALGLKKAREAEPEKSFKDVVNDLLRRGLDLEQSIPKKEKTFKVSFRLKVASKVSALRAHLEALDLNLGDFLLVRHFSQIS
ncbi:MAG: hypothetical protein ABIP78_09875 [Pyrinomonadaceae bacterium]